MASKKHSPNTTAVELTDNQRRQIAEALGIDVQYVPAAIGVLGVPRSEAEGLRIQAAAATTFSPALVMT